MLAAQQKAALRAEALARRDALGSSYRALAAQRIAERVAAMTGRFRPGHVSVFWPIRSEVDTRPIMDALHAGAVALALPVVQRPGLCFRAWHPGEPLTTAGFGLSEPLADAPTVAPATLLVPLAAFDRDCHRIGYGAGFYDRAINELSAAGPPLTIGLAFTTQEVARVPAQPHDCPLDFIVTEDAVFVRPETR